MTRLRLPAGLLALSLIVVSLLVACGGAAGRDSSADMARILELEDRRTLGDGALTAYLDPDMPLALRVRAVLALGRIGSPVARPALLARSLVDHAEELRRMAAFSLGEMDDPAAVPFLVDALDDSDVQTRALAVEALGKLKAAGAVHAMLPLLDDPDPEVAGMTLLALWKVDPGDTLSRQVEAAARLQSTARGELRRRAAYFLMRSMMGHPDDAGLETALLGAAGDDDPLLRSFVARGLGASKTPAATAALLKLAGNPDWRVRVNAFNGLGTRPVESGWPTYAAGLADADTGVRLAALASLATCRDAAARRALEENLGAGRPRLREVALRALAARDGKTALPLLAPLASDPVWSVRARTSEALAPIEDDRVGAIVARLAGDDDPRVRAPAVAAAGAVKAGWGSPIVLDALDDDDTFRQGRRARRAGRRHRTRTARCGRDDRPPGGGLPARSR